MLILNKYIFLQMTAVNTSQIILLRKTFKRSLNVLDSQDKFSTFITSGERHQIKENVEKEHQSTIQSSSFR